MAMRKAKVARVLELYAQGLSDCAIARETKLARATVFRVRATHGLAPHTARVRRLDNDEVTDWHKSDELLARVLTYHPALAAVAQVAA